MVFSIYILIVFGFGIYSYFHTSSIKDYMLGGRSLGPVMTGLGVGVADMSSWLLLALPGTVMLNGLNRIWLPMSLVLGSFLNWHFVSKRLRVYTEILDDSITIPSYLEKRFDDFSGTLRFITSFIILVFFIFYVASSFVAGGLLFGNIFEIDYISGVYLTSMIIVSYIVFGGLLAISWVDFFQGLLMFFSILIVPIILFNKMYSERIFSISTHFHASFFSFRPKNYLEFLSSLAWGLGYFGQPHILIRFMATKSPNKINLAKYVCTSWMFLSLLGALSTGLLGRLYYINSIQFDPETIFILLARELFSPWLTGILFASIFSAIMSSASAQLIASSSALVEDLYHKFLRPKAKGQELVRVSRAILLLVTIISVLLARDVNGYILDLVGYAWAGLGSSIGPTILISLFWGQMNKYGAVAGIISGSTFVLSWPYLCKYFKIANFYSLLPSFIFSCFSIIVVNTLTRKKRYNIPKHFLRFRTRFNKN